MGRLVARSDALPHSSAAGVLESLRATVESKGVQDHFSGEGPAVHCIYTLYRNAAIAAVQKRSAASPRCTDKDESWCCRTRPDCASESGEEARENSLSTIETS